MLTFFTAIANKLARFQRLFILIASASFCGFIGLLFFAEQGTTEQYLFANALLLTWSLLILLLTYAFKRLPVPPLTTANWLKRLSYRLKSGLLQLLAIACSLLLCAAIFISVRLINFGFLQ